MKPEYLVALISIIIAISSIFVAYRLSIVIQQLHNEIVELNKSLSEIKNSINRLKGGIRGIVYILPYNICSAYWHDHYGDRIYFYVYENLSKHIIYINKDFSIISNYYNNVIIIIPAENTTLFYYNLRVVSCISRKYNLTVLWAIFPKWKFGSERDYLKKGTMLNKVVINLMNYLVSLNNTYKVALWYGWTDNDSIDEIFGFYNMLSPRLKKIYAIWIDQPYVSIVKELSRYEPRFLVITELYDTDIIKKYSGLVPHQMIVTGYSGASSKEQWLTVICKKILLAKNVNNFGIWIYYDINDGMGERYAAYFGKEGLANPWVCLLGKNKH